MRNAQGTYSWGVTPEKVEMAIRRIIEVCYPLKLILFGSYVRGETNINSDLDILIITHNDVANERKESIRIRRALRGISMPMDIIVISEEKWTQVKNRPGMIYRQALKEGKIVYESQRYEKDSRLFG